MVHRILFVSQQLPWPTDSGGNIRTYFMLQALARRFEVVLCSTSDGSPVAREGEQLFRQTCAEVLLVPDEKRHSRFGQALGVLRSLLSGQPAVLAHNENARLREVVQGVLAAGRVTSIHLNHLDTTSYVDPAASPPIVLDTHNLLFDYYARRAVHESSPLSAWACRREARLLAGHEPRLFRAAARVVVCSEVERERLRDLDACLSVEVVPNGVDCASICPKSPGATPASRELVFVGDLAYGPNADAALYFIAEVLPLVREREPRARFLAVGKHPSPELIALGRERDDVIVTGFVEQVAGWIERAACYVVPLRYGSGTRLKVLEAFAYAMPTVSTSLGAEGIDCTDGEDILIRDTPRAMAEGILELLGDPPRAERLAARAREKVVASYDWSSLGERVVELHGGLRS